MNTKNIIFLLLLFFGLTAHVYAVESIKNVESIAVSGQLALADADGLGDMGTALVVTGNKMFPTVHELFSVEGEFSTTLTKPSGGGNLSSDFLGIDSSSEMSYFTLGGYSAMTYPVSPKLSVKGRLGLVYMSSEVSGGDTVTTNFFDGTSDTLSTSSDDTSMELSFGFGAIYDLNNKMKLTAGFTSIGDVNHIGAGIQYDINI